MLNENVKWNNDGTVDVEGTLRELRGLVERFAVMTKEQNAKISKAVDEVFAEFPNDPIQLPTLAGFAATKMGTALPDYSETVERIKDYVRGNSKYHMAKGRNGGVSLSASETPEQKATGTK